MVIYYSVNFFPRQVHIFKPVKQINSIVNFSSDYINCTVYHHDEQQPLFMIKIVKRRLNKIHGEELCRKKKTDY